MIIRRGEATKVFEETTKVRGVWEADPAGGRIRAESGTVWLEDLCPRGVKMEHHCFSDSTDGDTYDFEITVKATPVEDGPDLVKRLKMMHEDVCARTPNGGDVRGDVAEYWVRLIGEAIDRLETAGPVKVDRELEAMRRMQPGWHVSRKAD